MQLHAAPLATLYALPDGPAGTRQTLRLMARLVREAKTGDLSIRQKAADIVAFVPGNDWAEQARLLFEYVRDRVRYLGDVNGAETIQTPAHTLRVGYGDCDDKSTLLAALLESIGHPARFIAVGFGARGDFDHVFVETKIGGKWIAMETTLPVPFGWSPLSERRATNYMPESI